MRWMALIRHAVMAMAATTPALAQPACPVAESRSLTITDIDQRLELVSSNGEKLRVFGVDFAGGAQAAVEAKAWLAGRVIDVDFVDAADDRWGRRAARVFASLDGDVPESLADWLIERGLARARPEAGAAACLAPLFALEAAARASGAGLWSDPANAAIPAAERARFEGRDGQNVVVEGEIVGVGQTATRLYLNFGPVRSVDFAATATTAMVKTLNAAGLDPRALTGANVRVRGLLDRRFGPQIEIDYPSQLEIVARGAKKPYSGSVAPQRAP